MTPRLTRSLIILAALMLSACNSDKGITRIDLTPGEPPAMNKAKEPGDYALYIGSDPSARVVHHLELGEPLGFRRNDIGQIQAVAGKYVTTFKPDMGREARWELKPEK